MSSKPSSSTNDTMRILRLVAIGGGLLLLTLFIALNFQSVQINLLFVETSTRLAIALILTSVLGFIVGYASAHIRFD